MNDQQIIKNWRSFHAPGCSHLRHRAKNAIYISSSNSIKHELAKCIGAIMVQRYGNVKFDSTVKTAFDDLCFAIQSVLGPELSEPNFFLTEAVPNDRPKRRLDLVNINTLDEFEFETNLKEHKKGAVTIYI